MNQSIEQWDLEKRAVSSEAGMVAAQHLTAARAGASMLAEGGNAVDAALAAALALAVVEPWMCGLGGSGYMVIWLAAEKRAYVLDFQGVLPMAIDPSDYPQDQNVPMSIMGFPGVMDRRNEVGFGAITVPGAVKGFATASARFGRLGFDRLLVPAIRLAEQGHPTTWFSTLQIALGMRDIVRNSEASAIFLPDGAPPLPERHLPLPALARTLRTLASDGPDSFYSGVLAETIVADLQAGGSRIDLDDLKGYQVVEPSSLQTRHRGTDIHTAGPTSGGPRLIEALAHIETHLDRREGLSPANWKVYANALEKAWQSHKRKIKRTTEIGSCTSHLSTVDADGNMVALTYTLLNRFGSCVLLPRSGILMNNAVSYFDTRPGFPTTMTGGKRINASNMCPIIATRNDQARFAIGASGANHITPCTTQIAAMMLDFGFGLEQAFNHGRIDASDRGSIRVDPRLGEEVLTALGEDFELEVAQRLVFPKLYSCPSGVSRDPNSGRCLGMNDPSQPIGGAAPPAPFRLDQTRQVDQPRA